jgi:SET domain-containing protein
MARSLRMNNQWVFARPSPIHGQGLFARVDIPPETNIVEYSGPRLSVREGKRLADHGNVYLFRVNRREFIDGSVAWNLARHANHSCAPNAVSVQIDGAIWLRSNRAIARGEEITYDYGYSWRGERAPCRCDSATCSGFIMAAKDRTKMR